MFVVLLKFGENKSQAGHFTEGHKEWLKRGFDDGILAHNTSLEDLQVRVGADPFVMERVVSPEILELTPSRADERLKFLLA
jgi:hypothetical protein